MSAPENAVPFGVLLRGMRERAGLSQQELAERAGLTTHAVSALERGTRTRPYPHTVRSLADALESSADDRQRLVDAVPRRRGTTTARDVPLADGTRPVTPLHGREADVDGVVHLVHAGWRLVTLTGAGGVGKTRLAAAVAQELADEHPDGVVEVLLAPISDAGAVVPAIARAFGVVGADGPGALERLVQHLRPLRVLLVLDNLEHLLSAVGAIGDLVAACPGLTALATSRSPLRLRAEHEYVVPPLDLPPYDVADAGALAATPAGALLFDRIRAVVPRHTLDVEHLGADDVAACVELCHRLAGIPLAIELAAPHLRLLTPRVLVERLDEAMAVSAARDLPERQRTMRATLDWSRGLLAPRQAELFALLGVFRGGTTLDVLEDVAERTGWFAAGEVLALLQDLVEHSLVVVRPGSDGSTRFAMLEPIAQYARTLLVGDRAAVAHAAHAAVHLGLARRAAVAYERREQLEWLARTDAEEPNLLVAVERSLDAGDTTTAAVITWSLWLYWWLRGQVVTGRRMAERCLAADPPPGARCRVALTAATMSFAAGDIDAAAGYWEHSGAIAERLQDFEVLCKSRAGRGLAALARGDFDLAGRSFGESLEFSALAGDADGLWMASMVHVWLGTVLQHRGDVDGAVASTARGLEIGRERGDRRATYVALYNLSQIALGRDDRDEARRHLDEGIRLTRETRDYANLAYFLEALAVVEQREERSGLVATLYGAAAGLREHIGANVYAYYLPGPELRAGTEAAARAAIGDPAYDAAHAAGHALGFDEVVALVDPDLVG